MATDFLNGAVAASLDRLVTPDPAAQIRSLDRILSYTDTIMEPSSRATNEVRHQRLAREWSQAELARRAGVSRAAISAIEISRLVPSVAAALTIARVFGCSVESLFGSGLAAASAPEWAWPPPKLPCRYWLAEVRGRFLRFPVEASASGIGAHDGVCRAGAFIEDVRAELGDTLVLAGCDPAASLLAAEYTRATGFRLLNLVRSGRQALTLLAQGLVHVAGVHFATDGASGGNEHIVLESLGTGHRLLRLARWDEGLAVASGSAVSSVRDALRTKLRWVGREPGSAARQCLDELRPNARPLRRFAHDHRGVAEAVRCGWADAGVCHRLAGEEAGLRVFTVRREHYDLCYPADSDANPRVEALVRVVRSTQYRQLLMDLPGFDMRRTGESRIAL
jgi:molybdate-binding protein/DNA-binding XRE family transcriptional regulator